ncbi:MAG: type II toxin-antitoxin system VapC family toxin [Geminicoccaceae bacterium]
MIVIDTSAIFAIAAREPEAVAIRTLLKEPGEFAMSAFTVFECRTVLHRRLPRAAQSEFNQFLQLAGVQVDPFDQQMAEIAFAAYRTMGKGSGHKAQLNLGDCASYALAIALDAPLLFKGSDFLHTDVKRALA